MTQPPPIAIIGMACIFPGAHSAEELWRGLLVGRRWFRRAPEERLPAEYFDEDASAPDKSYTDKMAVITGWEFDPMAFGIPPVSARSCDVAHWLALFTANEAIRDSGLDLDAIDRSRVGVSLGNTMTGEFSRSHALRLRWPYFERSIRETLAPTVSGEQREALLAAIRENFNARLPEASEDSLAGNMSNTIVGRICSHFDLGGGGFTIDGACSSSLLAMATACKALRNGEVDYALAGGVDVSLDPFEIVGFAKAHALTRDDIRPYDERASGMLPGEGCGIFVLSRADEARQHGHRIHALVRGWGHSTDGRGAITAPSVAGQVRALRQAYEIAGYPMSSVGLLEGHGTGTALGDKVELAAVLEVLADSEASGEACHIGSIKGNIGHCKAAAGAAGLIKAVMALKRKILPPTAKCERPSPAFERPMRRLRPCGRGEEWTLRQGARRASVSAMGFGGANAHIALEEALEEADREAGAAAEELALLRSQQATELLLLSAATATGLNEQIRELEPIARRISRAELSDVAAALADRDACLPARLAIVSESPWQLEQQLTKLRRGLDEGGPLDLLADPAQGVFAGIAAAAPKLVALFPGQGSQYLGMGRHLRDRHPFVGELYELAEKEAAAWIPGGLEARIRRDLDVATSEQESEWRALLRDTRTAQPAITLTSLATLRVLRHFGLEPDLAIGHSLGEIAALHCAGAFDAATALRLAVLRGQAMGSLELEDCGAMAAIRGGPTQVRDLLSAAGPSLVISNFNSPKQTVVSGASPDVDRLMSLAEQRGLGCRRLPVSHAFHSTVVAPAADSFERAIAPIEFDMAGLAGSRVTLLSTATGDPISADCDLRRLLAGHIRTAVRFEDAVRKAAEVEPALYVEVGPGGVLTSLMREILQRDGPPCMPTDLDGEDGFQLLGRVLGSAYVLGFPVESKRLFDDRYREPFPLDDYAPVFITNPCERAIGSTSSRSARTGFPVPAIAAEARAGVGRNPLDLADNGRAASALERTGATGAGIGESPAALLDFAIAWIVNRTGFPPEMISPETRLFEDLNLDSIKVGELLVVIADELDLDFDLDPEQLGELRILDVVDAVLAAHHESQAAGPQAARRLGRAGEVDGLEPWVRSFPVRAAAMPLAAEREAALPGSDALIVAPGRPTPHVRALVSAMEAAGLSVSLETTALSALRSAASPRNSPETVVVVLPEVRDSFLNDTAEAFDERVEGTAELLFRVFRRVGGDDGRGLRNLHALVLRPGSSEQADLDAGGAFLKSLAHENPDACLKWVNLPSAWTPPRWANVALRELLTRGPRIVYQHSTRGERTAAVAVPWNVAAGKEPEGSTSRPLGGLRLAADDVLLVSGGAKGVTFELAFRLACEKGLKLALIGSSPPPGQGAEPDGNPIPSNLARLCEAGVAHAYWQCDVTDLEAVLGIVPEVEARLGPISGLLHGAGISELRLFPRADLPSVLRCLRVKIRGLYNLLRAAPPESLKALHVISSVVGHTGMRQQADYAWANAWLDSALGVIKRANPELQCLSLGYSIWAETGMGTSLGSVDALRRMGVLPIGTHAGAAAYVDLVDRSPGDSSFVITSRLTADLEKLLYAPAPACRGRFLEAIRRRVPGTELVADAFLSHETDPYLSEHVFEGTPILPGVMAIEAMVEAAKAVTGRSDLPVVRNIEFQRPVVVPVGAATTVRTLAQADPARPQRANVRVAIRSSADRFARDHVTAECLWDEADDVPDPLPVLGQLPEPLPIDPESLHPTPLFQGELFRRIRTFRTLTHPSKLAADAVASLAEISVPRQERYYETPDEYTNETPSPIARDACLQAGAASLPAGYLPTRLSELRFYGTAAPGERLSCKATVRRATSDAIRVDLEVFDGRQRLLETITGLELSRPRSHDESADRAVKPTRCSGPVRIASDLEALLGTEPVALGFSVTSDAVRGKSDESAARACSTAKLTATRSALLRFASRLGARPPHPEELAVGHEPSGRPEILAAGEADRIFAGADLSISDSGGMSVAAVGTTRLGIDIEAVEARDAPVWRGLLGSDGYALALEFSRLSDEPFDIAATRIWTLLEAGGKAIGEGHLIPAYESALGSTWHAFGARVDGRVLEYLCTLLEPVASGPPLALSLARVVTSVGRPSARSRPRTGGGHVALNTK